MKTKNNNDFSPKLRIAQYFYCKAYSSEVERTAHNGLVVGSNPAKPKNLK